MDDTEPDNRPTALSLIIDISDAVYGTTRIVDLIKSNLISCFSIMDNENLMCLRGACYEDPGSSVAAISKHPKTCRNFTSQVSEAIKSLTDLDRFYRRQLLLITDQFEDRDEVVLRKAVLQNIDRVLDIDLYVVAYGPQYSRLVEDCGWSFNHVEELSEMEGVLKGILKAVCK